MMIETPRAALVAALLIAAAVPTGAQSVDVDECRTVLHAALRRHHATPDSGTTIQRSIELRLHRGTVEGIDTLLQRIELSIASASTIIVGDGFELHSDDAHTVRCNRVDRSLHVLEHRRHRKGVAAQRRVTTSLPDSLIEHSTIEVCDLLSGDARRIVLSVDTTYRRFYNADTVELIIDANGSLAQMTIDHPQGSAHLRSEYRIVEHMSTTKSALLATPVASRFFDHTGRVRTEYADYRLLGRTSQ